MTSVKVIKDEGHRAHMRDIPNPDVDLRDWWNLAKRMWLRTMKNQNDQKAYVNKER